MTSLTERARLYLQFSDPFNQSWSAEKAEEWLNGNSYEARGLKAAHAGVFGASEPRSVLQDWVMALSTRQQGVLILALRGPDGSPKESAAKPIVRTLRALVMVSGRERQPMDFDVAWRDDTFMNTVHISQDGSWEAVTRAFFGEMDAYNLHFFQHLIHAFAVVGVHFPVVAVRSRCWGFYLRACHKLHVHAETPEEIVHRLRDGIREEDTPDGERLQYDRQQGKFVYSE